MADRITLVKRGEMSAAAAVGEDYSSLSEEIDLGLGLNEAAFTWKVMSLRLALTQSLITSKS
jgi:hypothetical protein